ncbi:quinone oxidoreductase PIG3 [Salpingoeca rosetta]|uniref:Quinone oxidoreductase PIG3 n=1 Tax=Salpingoeca rosetta (strain ATCC 50818 / BSB-021) TaxID=946362 RepID=F2UC67_SALR5|nr:quinone oxidoreductase PIG3 [Salpingoeca rosetta]EGD74174.1 quinone oxidoreductase PIG3 [Salpingoeca rosetta]|eukprot:XP_004993074.1 quinone oxidoreductase PIG3 [Salpingoeca rosetta]
MACLWRTAAASFSFCVLVLLVCCAGSCEGVLNMADGAATTMRAVVQTETGGPQTMSVGSVSRPKPGQGEVLIKVMATAVNRADTLQRQGWYPPPAGSSEIIGLEASGVVEIVGEGCSSKFKVGDPVIALLAGGGYAEYCTVPEGQLMPLPSGFSFVEGAAIPEGWLTAYQLLHFVGSVKKGDYVLIHAGASGVGLAAVQLTVAAGAIPVVTVGSPEKLASAVALGAVGGANRHEGPWIDTALKFTDGKGFNLVLDCVAGSYWEQNAQAVALDGTWVLYALMGGADIDGPLFRTLLKKRVTLVGTTLRTRSLDYKRRLISQFTQTSLPKFSSGQFKVSIAKVFPLDQVADSHTFLEENKNTGKIILQVHDGAQDKPQPQQQQQQQQRVDL